MPKLVVIACFILSLVSADLAVAQARDIEGRVTKVRDVDTFVVAGTAVRLNGVDGPETSNRYGREAKAFMQRLVGGKYVTCDLNGTRTYDRWVGTCFLDGEDIGVIAISQGQALDCPRYSGGAYQHLETQAAKRKLPRAGYCR
jgi:endonuclease YncB( thermonuclease family)